MHVDDAMLLNATKKVEEVLRPDLCKLTDIAILTADTPNRLYNVFLFAFARMLVEGKIILVKKEIE